MPFLPILGKLVIKYVVPLAAQEVISWGWKKLFRKKDAESSQEH